MPTIDPLYPATDALPLLADESSRYRKLKTDAERADQLVVAEMLLGLSGPVYTGRTANEIMYGIALQVNFQLDQGFITAQQLKSISTGAPASNTTSYRDRYLHPGAAAIIARATGMGITGFTAPPPGV
jgi:uncharacterized protein YlaN (UPF0358 family)